MSSKLGTWKPPQHFGLWPKLQFWKEFQPLLLSVLCFCFPSHPLTLPTSIVLMSQRPYNNNNNNNNNNIICLWIIIKNHKAMVCIKTQQDLLMWPFQNDLNHTYVTKQAVQVYKSASPRMHIGQWLGPQGWQAPLPQRLVCFRSLISCSVVSRVVVLFKTKLFRVSVW